MFRKVDAVRLHVDSLDDAIKFYVDSLGHKLVWRRKDEVGIRLGDTDTELVLVSENIKLEVDLLVDSVEQSILSFKEAGGSVIIPTFDIQIGKCAVVKDPWENELVLVEMSKGTLKTDGQGYVVEES